MANQFYYDNSDRPAVGAMTLVATALTDNAPGDTSTGPSESDASYSLPGDPCGQSFTVESFQTVAWQGDGLYEVTALSVTGRCRYPVDEPATECILPDYPGSSDLTSISDIEYTLDPLGETGWSLLQTDVVADGSFETVTWSAPEGVPLLARCIRRVLYASYYVENRGNGPEGAYHARALNTDFRVTGTLVEECEEPAVPENLTVSACSETGTVVSLAWDAVDGADTYEVEDTSRGFIVYVGSETSVDVTGLTPGEELCFRVRAVREPEEESSFEVLAANSEWTDSGVVVPEGYDLRILASGVVIFNNQLDPVWYAYPEGGYTPPGDDNDFGLVDYYNPNSTFYVPINQISGNTRPHSLAAVTRPDGDPAPPNTAGSVTDGLTPNRYAHFASGDFTPGRVYLIQNDEEGFFFDNELAFDVTVQAIAPCDVSGWSDTVCGRPGVFVTAPVFSGARECCGRQHRLTWEAVDGADAYELYHATGAGDVLVYSGSDLEALYSLTRGELLFTQQYRLRVVSACGDAEEVLLSLGPLYVGVDACDTEFAGTDACETGFGEVDGVATGYVAPLCGEG